MGAVNGGPPQEPEDHEPEDHEPEDHDPARPRARAAVWCMAAGIILGTAAVICLISRLIVVEQAIAMALPSALLVIGGVICGSPPDAATSERLGFHTGFQLGSVVNWLRSLFRRPRNGD
jgi:hypothetical protein